MNGPAKSAFLQVWSRDHLPQNYLEGFKIQIIMPHLESAKPESLAARPWNMILTFSPRDFYVHCIKGSTC